MHGFKSNITQNIKNMIGRNLHNQPNHPVSIIKNLIIEHFLSQDKFKNMMTYDNLSPYVDVRNNFDLLLIPATHPARRMTDTYYLNETTVLRTHTSAHQNELLKQGIESFLVFGDVYRKDEIDRSHYPVFHQVEGVVVGDYLSSDECLEDLRSTLRGLIHRLFPDQEYRFLDDYFPFTEPSLQVEVKFGDWWLEILGCGCIHPKILEYHGIQKQGYAFGFGLDRLAMIRFSIPDIRLLWSDDPRFLSQFNESNTLTKYVPFPSLDPISRDISFWIKSDDIERLDQIEGLESTVTFTWLKINDFYDLIREICGNMIECVDLYDKFFNKKTQMYSHTFRLTFASTLEIINPSELKATVDQHMTRLRDGCKDLNIELR
jgi:phenylalanyl-tRNA synthetase alpha chain